MTISISSPFIGEPTSLYDIIFAELKKDWPDDYNSLYNEKDMQFEVLQAILSSIPEDAILDIIVHKVWGNEIDLTKAYVIAEYEQIDPMEEIATAVCYETELGYEDFNIYPCIRTLDLSSIYKLAPIGTELKFTTKVEGD